MEMCFKILSQEKRVTQRELFYKLLCVSPDCFSSQLQVNRTFQGLFFFLRIGFCSIERMVLNLCVTDVVGLLRCSRYSLGIMASSRGIVAGRLLLQANN
jgi:meiotic recombination protein SPO11